jgi:hypothetical protein
MIKIDTLQKKNQKQKQQIQYSLNKNSKVQIFESGIFCRFGRADLRNHIKQRKQRFRYNYFEEKLYVRFDEKLKKIYMPSKYVKFPNLGHY